MPMLYVNGSKGRGVRVRGRAKIGMKRYSKTRKNPAKKAKRATSHSEAHRKMGKKMGKSTFVKRELARMRKARPAARALVKRNRKRVLAARAKARRVVKST